MVDLLSSPVLAGRLRALIEAGDGPVLLPGKEVVPVAEFAATIRAAVEARSSPEFLIIARTDARAPHGLDEARRRADTALEAGADALFVEALQTRGEIEAVTAEYRDTPLLHNWVEGGRSPSLSYADLTELGFALVIMPITILLAATAAIRSTLDIVKAAGTPVDVEAGLPSFDEFTDLIGLAEITELHGRFV